MSNPSDFSPSEVIDARSSNRNGRADTQNPWPLRIGGLVLLIVGWALIALPEFGSTRFLISTAVLAILGGYALFASTRSRRIAVTLEKKLRLDLLVHNVELQDRAMRDDLTQLFNRRYFFERLERELQNANGFGRPLGVAIIDLDSMKQINDTYGHRSGDRLLAAFGKFLLKQTRASDVAARIGGDEFAIILADADKNEAEVMVERLEAALDKADLMDGEASSFRVVASVGLAGFPWSAETTDELVRQADASMSAKKHEHQLADAREDEKATVSDAPAESVTGAEATPAASTAR